ncbi:hypothetical protein C0585_03840 [Candidatus Woesearchaeota archaeon]|nr:MAG: hypothetical protein C0585_03840 [Candidatus Woesearchaeota archaeon]
MKIKDISLDNRPRERFKRFGSSNLSDAELLALILQKGSKSENVVDMSNRLLSAFPDLSKMSMTELMKINGVGEAKAMQILALFEFSKRHSFSKASRIIKSPRDVFEYNKHLSELDKEHFVVLMLDTKNNIIKDEVVSIGTLNTTIVHPREIFKNSIKESANSIILVHNHPSGDPNPSEEDLEITKRLIEAGEMLDIKVLDHVIIGKEDYWSWKDR